MNKLSDRLKLIADNIECGETMADIGTDHGFLPMYLLENEISPRVIMADISKGSLDKAKANFETESDRLQGTNKGMLYKDSSRFDFRLGSGLEVIGHSEVDTVVMAGMGGRLMIELMQLDFNKTASINKFILQPRNGQGHLRHWLRENGFIIEKELLVKEIDNICNILVVKTGDCINTRNNPGLNVSCTMMDSKFFREYEPSVTEELPEEMIAGNHDLGSELFFERLEHYKEVLKLIRDNASKENSGRDSLMEEKIEYIERMVEKYA